MILTVTGRTVEFPRRPLIMGIVNINDDSFAGDGSLEIERAVATAQAHVLFGADIIDVGGESARTNRSQIDEDEESARIMPFIDRFRECYAGKAPVDGLQLFPPLLSINTWRPKVAEAALRHGGDLLNDLSALPTDENAVIAAKYGAGLLIMHSVGLPKHGTRTSGTKTSSARSLAFSSKKFARRLLRVFLLKRLCSTPASISPSKNRITFGSIENWNS